MIMPRVAELKEIEPKGVGHHAEAGQTHRCRAEHRVQRQPQRDKHARREGNADGVVEKCPEEVFVNVAECRTAQADGRRNIEQTALHENYVRRIDGNVGAGSDGNADICSRKCRRVVDAVSDHGNLALRLELANFQLLALRQNACDDLIHACLTADGPSSSFIVARQHHDANAHILKLAHGLRAVFFDDVCHGDHAEKPAVETEIERGLAFVAERLCLFFDCFGNLRFGADKFAVAAAKGAALIARRKAVSRQGLKFRNLVGRNAERLGAFQNCLGKRVLALLLKRNGEAEELLLRDASCRENVCDRRFAGSNRAGFVEGDDLDTAGFLEACRRFEENAVLCAKAASDHDGNRGRKTKCARAADDEHGNPARKAVAEGLSDEEPHNRGHKCDGDDRRNKNAGDLVCDFCDRRFGGRRVGDHLDDLRERRVLSHAGGAAGEKSRLIDGCSRNRIAGGLVGGDALAGERRFVDCACAA